MTMLTMPETRLRLKSLAIFHGLMADPVVAAFARLCAASQQGMAEQVEAYGRFSSLLMPLGNNWSQYLLARVLDDDNFYVRKIAAQEKIEPQVEEVLQRELAILQDASRMSASYVAGQINCAFALPEWQSEDLDFFASYSLRMQHLPETGYGIFSSHHVFIVEGKQLLPVEHPDGITLRHLTGYQHERSQVLQNTLALLASRPAANVLLYGDSGTGKSTTVKAIANELRAKGLRLIELRKDQLGLIPWLIDQLNGNPLKFILFIDDLSFTSNSEQFSALKAVLEGSVFAKTSNMVIYATSNRRHLVRERFSERSGDEVHVRDTLEEISSLSERFGLVITFLRPNRELYWQIVEEYLERFGLPMTEDMRGQAETFALQRGGRSARVARQFAEKLASEMR